MLSGVCVPQCSEAQKLLNIAKELLHTEEAYIKRLHLLDQVTCLGRHLLFRNGVFLNVAPCWGAFGAIFHLLNAPVVLVTEIGAELD